ncbi:MAG: plastocyanin/azurin family copper-binding protein [Acidimicrobiia bacterium]
MEHGIRRRLRTVITLLGVVALSIVVAACGDDGGADTANPEATQVFGYDDAFAEEIVEIQPGDTVEWLMVGDNPHNVFASDGSWESDLTMLRGDRYERTFNEPGVVPYFCTLHGDAEGGGMAGYVIVGDVPEYERPEAANEPPAEEWTGNTITVPDDHATIQAAVDVAAAGDMVYVRNGVYTETVTVRTPSLIIRGEDRNETVLDGEFELSNGFHVVADAVAIENFTARNFEVNGFYWTGVTGYRGSYITAHNMGDYGIYAFDAVDGLFEHVFASGNRDSGIYIGQCYPCNAVVTDSISVENGLAYSGTNAGGELYLINSYYADNMGGVAPNSLDGELYPPHREVYIGGNLVINNNNGDAPTKGLARLAWGEGIILAGGEGDVVEKNLVVNHDRLGIVTNVLPDKNIWWASDNVVVDNTIAGTGLGDLGLVGPLSEGNCFEGNNAASWNQPPLLTVYHSCSGINLPFQMDLGSFFFLLGASADGANGVPAGSDHRTWPAPGPQENMPASMTSVVAPAFNVFEKPDLNAITTPDLPEGVEIRGKEIYVTTIPVTEPTLWTFLFSTWAYFLPLALVGAWIALAIWDMVRRQDEMSKLMFVVWFFVILLIPILGVIIYLFASKSKIPLYVRGVIVGGGILAYLIVLAVLMVMSGNI